MPAYALLEKNYQPPSKPPFFPQKTLPTMYDLPSENPEEPGLPDEFHYYQPQLLRETFRPPDFKADQVFVASDLNLYYDENYHNRYKRPDWFAVLGVDPLYGPQQDMRLSYVVWDEKVAPYIVVELLSDSSEKEDLGKTVRDIKQPPTKWEVYEQILKIPYYIIFGRELSEFRAFELSTKGRYQELTLPNNQLWLPNLKLGLGLWTGNYHNIVHKWLRWYNEYDWIANHPERLEAEKQKALANARRAELETRRAIENAKRAEQERQQKQLALQEAAQERQRAERLAQLLREQGIDPDKL
jgi:Uma2 family endonuclease